MRPQADLPGCLMYETLPGKAVRQVTDFLKVLLGHLNYASPESERDDGQC